MSMKSNIMTYKIIEIGGMKIHYSKSNIGTYKIHLVKCLVTGKFLKHSLAMNKLVKQSSEYLDTVLVLLWCFLVNVIGAVFLIS